MTKVGKAYNKASCFVCRSTDGTSRELTEHMDTELAASVLGAP
jgi:ketosteroid isomerase-like protein